MNKWEIRVEEMPQKKNYLFSPKKKYNKVWEDTDIISDIKLKRLGMCLKYYITTKLFSMKSTEPIWSYSYFYFRKKITEV